MDDIFKVLKKKKNCQPRTLFLAKFSFRNREIKTFPDKQKLRQLITTRSALQEMLKRSSPSWNERTIISNMKIYENIQHTGEGKFIVSMVVC